MTHNIGQMFYHGERPWHGLGSALPGPVNIGEAMEKGGLNFTVSLKPIVVGGEPTSAAHTRRAVVRDDRKPGEPGRVLGVVHPDFQLLQNHEGAELFDALYGQGREVYTTGGYLKHGEVIWLQARLAEPILVGAGKDELQTYLLFSNSHDGSYPIDIRLTTTRVVCNNTLNVAMRDKNTARIFRRGHGNRPAEVREDAQAFFESVLSVQADVSAKMELMTKKLCDAEAFSGFIRKLLPLPAEPARGSSRQTRVAFESRRANVLADYAALSRVFDSGYSEPWGSKAVQPPAERTFWGALNAVTAWVDHVREVDGDRFANVTFGAGASLKSRAFEAAVEQE